MLDGTSDMEWMVDRLMWLIKEEIQSSASESERLPPLSKLRSLWLLDDLDEKCELFIQLFLGIPSLRDLHCRKVDLEDCLVAWRCQNLSSAETAIFVQCSISSDDLNDLCNACTALKVLVLDESSVFSDKLELETLHQSLLLHRHSLKRLVLDRGLSVGDYDDPHPPMDPLNSMQHLKELSITTQLLTGNDSGNQVEPNALLDWFPHSLEVLTINSYIGTDITFQEFLGSLAHAGRAKMPSLRLIEVYELDFMAFSGMSALMRRSRSSLIH
ncbi:uncharacterized protein K452DRAFT_302018 [Aplosporella prunicola CBS 121167]|uniref:F-box domain-containing protein n=1 Tax=Aplosporella prunicola CBS 121167 TaxID=1176127 RepID=A0A6A6AZS2_9PEZI|nr:uncharacterized protein K452DRAFT_302018 [Aplosporella prunicola CBS 121167]KAF2137442.1 hypothetical protein K452DRAFT_302018 [Aplosporella prunicola CBS 121167]